MTDQWSVLATLTPTEYAQFRGVLGKSSGFQSMQYRTAGVPAGQQESRDGRGVRARSRGQQQILRGRPGRPSLYDEFLLFLGRRGYPIPSRVARSRLANAAHPEQDLVKVFTGVYDEPERQWDVYETCEELVDVEDTFQTWRFRHLKTVERVIGFKKGTGGSSGRVVPPARPRPHLLPGAVRRPHRDWPAPEHRSLR